MFLWHSAKKIPQHKNMLQLTDAWDVETARQLPRKEILTVTVYIFIVETWFSDKKNKHTIRCLISIEKGEYHCLWQMSIFCWDNLESFFVFF